MTNAQRLALAATAFVRDLRDASDDDLEALQGTLGTWASNSEYASTHEPMSGLCEAIIAEQRRRVLNVKLAREDEIDRIEANQQA